MALRLYVRKRKMMGWRMNWVERGLGLVLVLALALVQPCLVLVLALVSYSFTSMKKILTG